MTSRLVQYLAMLSGSFLPITSGINLGWASPYLPFLQYSEESPIPMTGWEASWCAVMPLVGAPLGALIAALLVDRIGRKYFLLTQAPCIALCFLAMGLATNVWVLCAARFLLGSTEGAIYTALPMYLGEISDPKIRGLLGSSISVAALLGILFINVIGKFYSIFESSLICACFPVLHFVTFLWMPESPYYLVKIGEVEKAKNSLVRFRGCSDINKELSEITGAVKRQEACEESKFLDLFTVKSNRKALFIYIILIYTNKFSGMNPVIFYTATIFEVAGGYLDSWLSVIVFSVAGVLGTIVALVAIDRFGRRPLMLFSALGCAFALSGEAFYFTVLNYFPEYVCYIGWLPVTALLGYNVIFCVGLLFGPVLFLSELFPTSVKANALGVCDTIAIIFGTFASKLFHVLTDSLGMYVPFWVFTICTGFGVYFIYMFVPETKGKSLESIQLELIGLEKEGDCKNKI